ncbi:hypothetical protein SH139x_000128 [Planctomycetaceae bacterium SH139]
MTTRKPMPTRKQTATDKQAANDKQASAAKHPAVGSPSTRTSPDPPSEARPDDSLEPAARAAARVGDEPTKSPGKEPGRHAKALVDDSVELVKKSSTGEDEPMGKEQPQAPFALVALSYFTVLALFGLILGWLYFSTST